MKKIFSNTHCLSFFIMFSLLFVLPPNELCAQTACTPVLVIPVDGAEMDNGCDKQTDLELWEFDWQDCEGATEYHLYVKGSSAQHPVINDNSLLISEFTFSMEGYIVDRNRLDWKWKVKALINGVWGEWSEERSFDVEPLNTDCTITAIKPLTEKELQISVFPNPASSLISVKLPDELADNVTSMRLIKMTSTKVYRYRPASIHSHVIDLDVRFIPEGIYVLTIEAGTRNITKKVLIQK